MIRKLLEVFLKDETNLTSFLFLFFFVMTVKKKIEQLQWGVITKNVRYENRPAFGQNNAYVVPF